MFGIFFISLRSLVLDLNPNFQSCNTLQTLLPWLCLLHVFFCVGAINGGWKHFGTIFGPNHLSFSFFNAFKKLPRTRCEIWSWLWKSHFLSWKYALVLMGLQNPPPKSPPNDHSIFSNLMSFHALAVVQGRIQNWQFYHLHSPCHYVPPLSLLSVIFRPTRHLW